MFQALSIAEKKRRRNPTSPLVFYGWGVRGGVVCPLLKATDVKDHLRHLASHHTFHDHPSSLIDAQPFTMLPQC